MLPLIIHLFSSSLHLNVAIVSPILKECIHRISSHSILQSKNGLVNNKLVLKNYADYTKIFL